jgi:hypothetical protein
MVSAWCFFVKKHSWIYSPFAILVRKLLSKPWNNHGMFWFSRGFPKFSQNSQRFPTTAMHQPRGCPSGAAAAWLCSRISGPSSCGLAVIRIYRGNVHSLKPGKQHKPCVFWISPAPNGPEKLQKGAPNWMPKDSPKFLRLSLTQSNQCGWEAWHQEGAEWHICTPVSLNSRMPATWRSVSCGIPLAKAELVCTWYDTKRNNSFETVYAYFVFQYISDSFSMFL